MIPPRLQFLTGIRSSRAQSSGESRILWSGSRPGGRWISYTSCEGHHHPERPELNSERHVGFLARSESEKEEIAAFLWAAIAALPAVAFPAVFVCLAASTVSDGSIRYAGVELYFMRRPTAAWEEYFEQVDGATSVLVEAIELVSAGRSE